jgi:tRNA(fMet)-specific endonuclease VapC
MKYLLDTCVLINHLRGKVRIDQKLIENGAAISVITWAELIHGVEKSSSRSVNKQLVEGIVEEFGIEILPIDVELAEKFGVLKHNQEKIGFKVEDFDLLIAATAMINNLILVTENKKHFNKIRGLKFI